METDFDPDLEDTLTELALTAVVAVSTSPASEALNVPGEPRIVGDTLLNCLRFPIEEQFRPDVEDAIVSIEDALDWGTLEVEDECHFVNVHNTNGDWRLDFSFHFVTGVDPDSHDKFPLTVGIAGLLIIDSTVVPDDQKEAMATAIEAVRVTLVNAFQNPSEDDPRWMNVQSRMLH